MSDTVVNGFNDATNILLPEKGWFRNYLDNHPELRDFIERVSAKKLRKQRFQRRRKGQKQQPDEADVGIERADSPNDWEYVDDDDDSMAERIERDEVSEHDLAAQLALSIRRVADDLQHDPSKQYEYEDWAHFTKMIRFSSGAGEDAVEAREEEEGLVEWDWIGEDSPMLAENTEPEWVLDRLCESLNRYTRWSGRIHDLHIKRSGKESSSDSVGDMVPIAEAKGGDNDGGEDNKDYEEGTPTPVNEKNEGNLVSRPNGEGRSDDPPLSQHTPTPLATGTERDFEFFDAPEKMSSAGSQMDLAGGGEKSGDSDMMHGSKN